MFCVASELCYFLLVLMYFRRGLRSVNIESYNYSLKCVANSRQALDGGDTRISAGHYPYKSVADQVALIATYRAEMTTPIGLERQISSKSRET